MHSYFYHCYYTDTDSRNFVMRQIAERILDLRFTYIITLKYKSFTISPSTHKNTDHALVGE